MVFRYNAKCILRTFDGFNLDNYPVVSILTIIVVITISQNKQMNKKSKRKNTKQNNKELERK